MPFLALKAAHFQEITAILGKKALIIDDMMNDRKLQIHGSHGVIDHNSPTIDSRFTKEEGLKT